ncbi:MAG: hypothetical protein FWE36_08565 [Erysipelotrichales bacterium]|nr:hypothetical protein [Erysipelotrichales bacterium]
MNASDWWVNSFGYALEAKDYTGQLIKKAAFDQKGSNYGWILEYILPLDKGGTKSSDNIWIVSNRAHNLRDGRVTYTIDNIMYQVQKDGKGGHAVYKKGNTKISFWEKEFGDATVAEDFTGREIHKGAYGQEGSRFGWDTDHIMPLSRGGTNAESNKQIVHIDTNDEKGDKTTFVSNDGCQYQVRKTSNTDEDYWANGYDYSDKKYCMVEIY